MRKAVERVAVKAEENKQLKEKRMNLANLLMIMTGYASGFVSDVRPAAEKIAFILHNNSDNLIAGEGDYNSSIGFMAHHLGAVLENPAVLQGYYDSYFSNRNDFYGYMMQGCFPSCYQPFENPEIYALPYAI